MFHNLNTILQKITRFPHGVHSPYAYSFLKNVVYKERKNDGISKFLRLIYRITQYFDPKNILIAGVVQTEILNAFKKAAPNSQILIEPEVDGGQIKGLSETLEVDLVFFSNTLVHNKLDYYFEAISKQCTSKSVWIIDGIRIDRVRKKAWIAIITHSKTTIKLDFNRFGIIFFDPKLSKILIKVGF